MSKMATDIFTTHSEMNETVSEMCKGDRSNDKSLFEVCSDIFDNYIKILEHNLASQNTSEVLNSELLMPNPFLKILSMFGVFVALLLGLTFLFFIICVLPRKHVEVRVISLLSYLIKKRRV